MARTQANRFAQFETVLGPDELVLTSLETSEGLSTLYSFDVWAEGQKLEYDLNSLIGGPASVDLRTPGGGRYFHGIITEAAFLGGTAGEETQGDRGVYRFTLSPWMWLLTRWTDSRIFQDQSVPDIIKAVFKDRGFEGFEDRLTKTYPKRVYCVQYEESDFAFVSRLMEQEGIFYFFEHEANQHTLILADAVSAHKKTPGYEDIEFLDQHKGGAGSGERFWSMTQHATVAPRSVSLSDFNFERPSANIGVKMDAKSEHPADNGEVFRYPAGYSDRDVGQALVKLAVDAARVERSHIRLAGDVGGLLCGAAFDLSSHPSASMNGAYVAASVHYSVTNPGYDAQAAPAKIEMYVRALPKANPFRPPANTPRAVVRGPQTAIVVGPAGEEIHVDNYGRVKVKFHWDRRGKNDDTASCWMRVAQVWAGGRWGAMAIPRVGQEVVVEFLEGDPDRPLITGRVYNKEQMPPYPLKGDKWRFTIQSRSEGGSGFNELRFDDAKSKEEVFVHAQRDYRTIVLHDTIIDIKNSRSTLIRDSDETTELQKGNRSTAIKAGSDALKISKGDMTTKVDVGSILFQAGKAIELKVGSNSIKIDQSGVTIKATLVKIEAQALIDAKAPMTTVKGDGMLVLKGGVVMIN